MVKLTEAIVTICMDGGESKNLWKDEKYQAHTLSDTHLLYN